MNFSSKPSPIIDLHTHSTSSDGSDTPSDILQQGEALPLEAVALTDHDTIAGVPEFLKQGKAYSVQAIPGVEIACSWYGSSLHIVGLFIDPYHTGLQDLLHRIRENRENRNKKMAAKLSELKMPISIEELQAVSGGEIVGRLHFASVLAGKGYVQNEREAFERYIGRNGPAYIPRFLPLPEEGIKTLHAAGGIAIWAHPLGGVTHIRPARIRSIARQLKNFGLDGIEIFYCDYTTEKQATAQQISEELGLLPSGGSDYHGRGMEGIQLGTGFGDLRVPATILPSLKQAAERSNIRR